MCAIGDEVRTVGKNDRFLSVPKKASILPQRKLTCQKPAFGQGQFTEFPDVDGDVCQTCLDAFRLCVEIILGLQGRSHPRLAQRGAGHPAIPYFPPGRLVSLVVVLLILLPHAVLWLMDSSWRRMM